jgi:hypothetical protein
VSSSHDNLVRRQEIEAALRSKPQRGRKRGNLSEVERFELTRTRNREHAKSTRNRKKARYQELLDNEQKLDGYLKIENLNDKRRSCVLDFLSIREGMLHSIRQSDRSICSDGSDGTRQVPNNGAESKTLQDVVEDIAAFTFSSRTEASGASTAVSRMQHFDARLISHLSSPKSVSILASLSYEVKGLADGIALTSGDTGFAEVGLVSSFTSRPLVVVHELPYAAAYKLRSAMWSTTSRTFNEGSSNRLDAQVSHPSVVSLDPFALIASMGNCGGEDKHSEQEAHGPGMDI